MTDKARVLKKGAFRAASQRVALDLTAEFSKRDLVLPSHNANEL